MKMKNGWVDYTNLALNVAQTAQLADIRNQLAQLQQLQLDEVTRTRIEDQIRQEVFEKEKHFKAIIVHSDQKPKAVYLHCSALKDWFDQAGVGPSTFREFNDKDRVQNILGQINEAITNTYDRLDAESKKDAGECRRFIEERNELEEYIEKFKELHGKGETPSSLKVKYDELRRELNAKQTIRNENEKVFSGFKARLIFTVIPQDF